MSEFALGSYVRKPSGAFWEGVVVGHYGTKQTEDGVAVQLFGWEDGPVQIYPASALQLCDPAQSRLAPPPPMIKALTDDELIRIQAAIQLEKPGMVVFHTPPPSPHLMGSVELDPEVVGFIAHQITGAIGGTCCHRTGGKDAEAPHCECRDAAERILEAWPSIADIVRTNAEGQS